MFGLSATERRMAYEAGVELHAHDRVYSGAWKVLKHLWADRPFAAADVAERHGVKLQEQEIAQLTACRRTGEGAADNREALAWFGFGAEMRALYTTGRTLMVSTVSAYGDGTAAELREAVPSVTALTPDLLARSFGDVCTQFARAAARRDMVFLGSFAESTRSARMQWDGDAVSAGRLMGLSVVTQAALDRHVKLDRAPEGLRQVLAVPERSGGPRLSPLAALAMQRPARQRPTIRRTTGGQKP